MTNQQKTEHELPSLISEENPFQLQQLATRSSQSLPSIIENNTETTSISFNDIQKEFDRISHLKNDPTSIDLSSLTNSDALSSIPYIDSSSLDDQEISERKHSNINRKISLSETDLLASLHRNLNKHIVDHDTTDDILFLEWDKERNLFQDYINSLRKEIRVLLQERLEYQQNLHHEFKHINDDQMKIDLLQKSLEEKNFVLEQFQTEYELIKEKNTNLIRKISLVQCDTKSYIGIIDELKQKITDLTIDLQNHVVVKRRLEISINNLENDCKIIDAERIRLTNDIKENKHNQQDLEKLLQKANVQIAEQGRISRLILICNDKQSFFRTLYNTH
jgi:chromosome segregation ATPase